MVIQQPAEQKNACVGGIHMLRLLKLGVKGLVVDGRVRDLSEIRGMDLPVSFVFVLTFDIFARFS